MTIAEHILKVQAGHSLSLGKFLMQVIAIVLGCAVLAACSSVEVASESIPPPDDRPGALHRFLS